jgi:hypothetical protein
MNKLGYSAEGEITGLRRPTDRLDEVEFAKRHPVKRERTELMLTARQAVEKAVEHLTALFPTGVSDVLLEEIEDDAASGVWRVTLSFARPTLVSPVTGEGKIPTPNPLADLILRKGQRQYKILEIDRENGVMRAMKMRLTPTS